MSAGTGGATGQGPGDRWSQVKDGYTQWIMLGMFTMLMVTIYFGATTILPPVMFLFGLFLLGHLDPRPGRALSRFWPAAGLSGGILVLAFFRSDFVELIDHGMGIGKAYATSTRYFQAPMCMWFTSWALICAAWNLDERGSRIVVRWLGWLAVALSAILLMDVAGNDGLRNWINVHWFGGHRPEMVVVDSSNLNAVVLMLFWPLAFWFMHKRWIAAVILMAVTILWASVVVDTNAHMLALVGGYGVWLATKYWPTALTRRGVLPERILAGLALLYILVFPGVILGLMRTGEAVKLRDHLPASWAARIDIWSTAVTHSLEKPWWGWGYEASRRFAPAIPLHTHDMSLQAWLELGVPGLLLLGTFWFCVFWFIAPRGSTTAVAARGNELVALGEASAETSEAVEVPVEQLARPYMLAGVAGYFLLNAISYGMWRAWLYCLGALMVVVAVMVIKAVKADNKLRI